MPTRHTYKVNASVPLSTRNLAGVTPVGLLVVASSPKAIGTGELQKYPNP